MHCARRMDDRSIVTFPPKVYVDMYVNGGYNLHEKKQTLMLHFIQYISTDDSCLLEKLSSVNPNIKSVMSEKAFPVQ